MTSPSSPAWALKILAVDVHVRPVAHLHEVLDDELVVIAEPAELNRLLALVRAALRASGGENTRPANSIEGANNIPGGGSL